VSRLLLIAALLLTPSLAQAEAKSQPVGVAGYFRIMARPDFQGGFGKLGFWNLYGRLLNEGPWAGLEVRIKMLEAAPGTSDPWTSVHLKIEGGAARGAEPTNGLLGQYFMTEVFVEGGNLGLQDVTWRAGTLWEELGDLGLYDFRPGTIFFQTVGVSARLNKGPLEVLVGVGDRGFMTRGAEYAPILNGGGWARVTAGKHLQVALGGQFSYEPKVEGNRFAPHDTPGLVYEDWLREEVLLRYDQESPGQLDRFPKPEAKDNMSFAAIGHAGFGGFGPLVWNSFYARFEQVHPQNFTTEAFGGDEYTLYVSSLTDQRYVLTLGNEAQFKVVPEYFDIVWGVLYGEHWDADNELAPSDHNRRYISTVLRLQAYPTRVFHILVETSVAEEFSKNGNVYRNHGDSIFASTAGATDSRGLEYGDSDTRVTWQGKAGIVLNPLGKGVYTRPSIRVLYGVQWSSQNQAWSNSFVQDLDQFNQFGSFEAHWHHVLALEAEAWF
jgi:hypothetical protein